MSVLQKITGLFRKNPPEADCVELQGRSVPIHFRRHPRARNYVLRLHADKSIVVTVPRNGTQAFARQFVSSRKAWLERQWKKLDEHKPVARDLRPGAEILLRGQPCALILETAPGGVRLRLDDQLIPIANPDEDLRPPVQRRLHALAKRELTERTLALAAGCQLQVNRITVRNQRSRWGSCSQKGAISLNWRLIQAPPEVRDYVILHELMHLRHLNHSTRFWKAVESVCPDYRAAEQWLKKQSGLIAF